MIFEALESSFGVNFDGSWRVEVGSWPARGQTHYRRGSGQIHSRHGPGLV
jgi:hypothetical protein